MDGVQDDYYDFEVSGPEPEYHEGLFASSTSSEESFSGFSPANIDSLEDHWASWRDTAVQSRVVLHGA